MDALQRNCLRKNEFVLHPVVPAMTHASLIRCQVLLCCCIYKLQSALLNKGLPSVKSEALGIHWMCKWRSFKASSLSSLCQRMRLLFYDDFHWKSLLMFQFLEYEKCLTGNFGFYLDTTSYVISWKPRHT